MAVYRLPPVAQFQQPRDYADSRSVDAPIPATNAPLQQIVWLRRRHDYEVELQQPRRLLDTSITQSTDAPIPTTNEPLQQIVWLRRRHDYEAEEQSRHLVDTGVAASVDAPIPQPLSTVEWLRRRADYEAEQQSRHLVDTSTSASVDAPNPQPLPVVVWLRRRPDHEADQQPRRLLDVTITGSVDSPVGVLAAQLYERLFGPPPQQARGLPVDILAPAVVPDNPTGTVAQSPSTARPVSWVPYAERPTLDVSYTASVDQPPTLAAPAPQAPRSRWQGQQLPPLAIDLLAPVAGPLGAVQQVAGYQRPTAWQQWLQLEHLDTSTTASVDSPPGFFHQPPPNPTGSGSQWRQTAARYLSVPDSPQAQPQPEVYARQVAAFQAWQKSPPVAHLLPVVEAPPLQGPWQTAPYRRPTPVPPVLRPSIGALVAPPILPAPVLTPPLTTTAVIDGRIVTTATVDGQMTSTAVLDGRRGSSATVDGQNTTTATVDGRETTS